MANPEHLQILNQGVAVWNNWRQNNPHVLPDLSGLDLSGRNLDEIDLSNANLSESNLSECHATAARFDYANLTSAVLRKTWLLAASLQQATLFETKLNDSYLFAANLQNAILYKAEFGWCNLAKANFQGADLREAILYGAYLGDANLRRSNLAKAILADASLPRADLREANMVGCYLKGADLYQCDLSQANLLGANLMNARLVEANLEGADLSYAHVYGAATWGLNSHGTVQSNLVITREDEPTITVDNLEVAQLVYLLLNNERIRDVIDTVSRKAVLILGRFTAERKAILDAIREELARRDYLPILFDFDKPATRDLTETIRILAHLSRFIIADITDPKSIPLELEAIVPDLAVPVQPLLQSGQDEFGMFVGLGKYPWVLATLEYHDLADLLASLTDRVIAPAEQKAKELEKR